MGYLHVLNVSIRMYISAAVLDDYIKFNVMSSLLGKIPSTQDYAEKFIWYTQMHIHTTRSV